MNDWGLTVAVTTIVTALVVAVWAVTLRKHPASPVPTPTPNEDRLLAWGAALFTLVAITYVGMAWAYQ